MSLENPVRALNAEVARKIAAGEVIDRPNAIVRELMDNAIDSGADSITVEINGGGIEKIRIVDNGCGMTKEDLQNCARPHATSKIATETDLMNLSTLGFRGEALASIAAVARLSIMSGGWKMRASITEDHILEQVAQTQGTIVQSEGLFENFPARRQFLKRAATEGVMCKNTFIEKAMARTDISFRFIQDGETKIDLPKNQTLTERFITANSLKEDKALFFEVSAKDNKENPDWSFTAVIGEPAVSRSNKKDIYIYTNGRRIQEYALVQAVEYGGQGFFPNGTYPVALVFIKVNPQLVDFNIHPAKKEARFYDISDLHHGLSSTIKSFYRDYTRKNFEEDKPTDYVRELDFETVRKNEINLRISETPQTNLTSSEQRDNTTPSYERHISYKPSTLHNPAGYGGYIAGGLGQKQSVKPSVFSEKTESFSTYEESAPQMNSKDFRSRYLGIKPSANNSSEANQTIAAMATQALEAEPEIKISNQKEDKPARFIGSALGTFLLAEKNNNLYIIDQHAVHERILFDKIMSTQGKRQPLLIPYKIKTESKSQDAQLEKLQVKLTAIGFETEKKADGYWEISSIPERWTGTEYDLRALLFVKQVEPEEIIRSIAAMTACKAAVKDGYVLDDITADRLVQTAFTLEDPHCPHGRPIYTVISRETLFQLVKRT